MKAKDRQVKWVSTAAGGGQEATDGGGAGAGGEGRHGTVDIHGREEGGGHKARATGRAGANH